ncbi:hypothetical protein SNEBB_000073 [Seison nebaliae]|nr:hypothetical protein SNEBB_000073 [Seison nebaliae]
MDFTFLRTLSIFFSLCNARNQQRIGMVMSRIPSTFIKRPLTKYEYYRKHHYPNYETDEKNSSIKFNNLLQDLLEQYRMAIPPITDDGSPNGCPVNLQIDMKIEQLFEVKEVQQSILFMAELYYRWTDTRLKWDPDKYNVRWTFIPKEKIWLPDIYLYENTAKTFAMDILPRSYLLVKYDGSIRMNIPLITETRCRIDVINFPYDTESCNISLGSYSFDNRYIILERVQRLAKASEKLYENEQWKLIEFKSKQFLEKDSLNNNFSIVQFQMIISRKPLFYMTYLVVPVIFMLILAPIVFLIPVKSGERISYSVTLLLTVIIFLQIIMELMPKSSTEVAKISIFYLTVTSESTLILVVNIIVVRIYYRCYAARHKTTAPSIFSFRICWLLSILIFQKGKRIPKHWKPQRFWTDDDYLMYYKEQQLFQKKREIFRERDELQNHHRSKAFVNTLIKEENMIKIEMKELDTPSPQFRSIKENIKSNLHPNYFIDQYYNSNYAINPYKYTTSEDINDEIENMKMRKNFDKISDTNYDWILIAVILDKLFFIIFSVIVTISIVYSMYFLITSSSVE